MSDPSSVDPQQAEFIARVRRLMLLTVGGTFLAVAVVVALIGYRLFRSGESAVSHATATAPVAASATLPAGAKVLSSAIGDGHIVLTVEVDGAIELRSFDLKTLKPLGRLRLAPKQ
jgi:hypothetical protein